ncbi:MAG: Fe-S cluster domain-containing protein [Sulfuritalea sp.]|nr:Fe-S cluster domain-containing protein [Sulfuritalea sp.]
MDLLHVALWGVLVFTTLGLFFGIALASAARKFHVPVNPLVEEVRENLPSANCGACGFAGCQTYAEKVVEDESISPSLCTPGGKVVAIDISRLTNKTMGEMKEVVAMLRCSGADSVARQQAEYDGIHTCLGANLTFGGAKACKYGCLGLGDCVRVCAFDAMKIGDLGIVEIDYQKCTGCGLCLDVCPKDCLIGYPRQYRVALTCQSKGKGKAVKDTCTVGCVQCMACIKECPAKAISIADGILNIDHVACMAYGPSCNEICVTVCPTDIIHSPGQQPDANKPKPKKVAKQADAATAATAE